MKNKRILTLITSIALAGNLFGNDQSANQQEFPITAEVVTTPTHPVVREGQNLSFTADYIYMTALEGGLPFARQSSQLGQFGSKRNRECYELHPGWDSGFRLGIGYNMSHDHWDTQASWTWLLSKSSDKESDPQNQLFALNAMPLVDAESGIIANTFESDIDIHLNIIKWDLGRELFFSQWLKARPFFGVKSAWVHQKWVTKATGNITGINNNLSAYFIKIKQDFWGIGPTFGINTDWGLISRLSLYANSSFSLLAASVKDSRNDQAIQAFPVAKINNPFHKESWQAAPVTELQVGLRWYERICNNHYLLNMQVGWDMIVFTNHVHWFAINGQSQGGGASNGQTQHLGEIGGDLLFHGLSVNFSFNF